MRFGESGGAEHRDARADEVQRAEAADEITDSAADKHQFLAPGVRPFKEHPIGVRAVSAE